MTPSSVTTLVKWAHTGLHQIDTKENWARDTIWFVSCFVTWKNYLKKQCRQADLSRAPYQSSTDQNNLAPQSVFPWTYWSMNMTQRMMMSCRMRRHSCRMQKNLRWWTKNRAKSSYYKRKLLMLHKTKIFLLAMLKTAYKAGTLGNTQVFECFSRFKSGEMLIDDKARCGRPSTAWTDKNVKKLHKIILEVRRQTIEEVADRHWVQYRENLRTRRMSAKFFPRLLTEEQKQIHVESCSSLKEEFKNNLNFFS